MRDTFWPLTPQPIGRFRAGCAHLEAQSIPHRMVATAFRSVAWLSSYIKIAKYSDTPQYNRNYNSIYNSILVHPEIKKESLRYGLISLPIKLIF